MIELATVPSPIGPLTVAARDGRLFELRFGREAAALAEAVERSDRHVSVHEEADPAGAASALQAYFAGRLDALDALQLDVRGTPFQLRVWAALRHVRPGHTASYSELARAIGMPAAVRAVGAANGANPIAIVVPCHRIIGTTGSLVGYGGGLARKQWLLQHEGALLNL